MMADSMMITKKAWENCTYPMENDSKAISSVIWLVGLENISICTGKWLKDIGGTINYSIERLFI
jgi:hypothetical protein